MFKGILLVLSIFILLIAFQFKRIGENFFKQLGIKNSQGFAKRMTFTYLFFGVIGIILSFIATKGIVFGYVIILLLASTFLSFEISVQMKNGSK